jgi:FkbM family methyltransferase
VSRATDVGWVLKIRPVIVADLLLRLLGPVDRRQIMFSHQMNIRLYVDPLTMLGRDLLKNGVFERYTTDIFQSEIEEGDTVLDVGANEGVFSALASRLVGTRGTVIAVEPQSGLRDIIEINLALNRSNNYRIYSNALGGTDDEDAVLYLYPGLNTGASSIVSKYRFSRRAERVKFITLERIFEDLSIDHLDFVKIDVEGYEAHVIRMMRPQIKNGKITKLLIDYHEPILRRRGLDPASIHQELLDCGMHVMQGDADRLSSYVFYRRDIGNT